MSDFVNPPFYRITYPQGVVLRSHGANGIVNTRGIDIELAGDRVLLLPVNSQREVASKCYLQLPADRDTLRAVIARLRELALALDEDPQNSSTASGQA